MRVGVVLPVFNRPVLVLDSLQTIAEQDPPADRVVIVDDGSEDNTADRVAEWIQGREGWSLIRLSENQGPSAARNRGIDALTDVDCIAFLDSDDLWPNDHLANMKKALTDAPNAIAAVADQQVAQQDGRTQLKKADWANGCVLVGLVRLGGCSPSALAVKTAALRQLGGFRESLRCHEDQDLLLRLADLGPFVRASGTPVSYRLGVACGEVEAASLSQNYGGKGAESRLSVVRGAFAGRLTARRRQLLAWAYFRAARVLFKNGSPARARSHCWSAIRLAPWYVRPWICLFRSFGLNPR